jgi:hypothetical protein
METENNTETVSEHTSQNPNKVTVGFKCHPELKTALLKEAKQLDISLSEYTESIVLNRQAVNKTESITTNDEILQYQKTIEQLKQRLAFYENNLLYDLYNAHKDEVVNYINSEGKTVELKINELTDVYTILINSFKINKP